MFVTKQGVIISLITAMIAIAISLNMSDSFDSGEGGEDRSIEFDKLMTHIVTQEEYAAITRMQNVLEVKCNEDGPKSISCTDLAVLKNWSFIVKE